MLKDKYTCVANVKASFATHSSEVFLEPLAVLPDPSLELLNFSTGVNSTPESDVVLVFSSIIIPSEDDRLCFEVAGLLAGRGNTLDKFSDPLEPGLSAWVESEPTSYNECKTVNCLLRLRPTVSKCRRRPKTFY